MGICKIYYSHFIFEVITFWEKVKITFKICQIMVIFQKFEGKTRAGWTTKICLVSFGQYKKKSKIAAWSWLKVHSLHSGSDRATTLILFGGFHFQHLLWEWLTACWLKKNAHLDFLCTPKQGQIWEYLAKSEKSTLEALFQTEKKTCLGYFSCTHRYQAIWGIK